MISTWHSTRAAFWVLYTKRSVAINGADIHKRSVAQVGHVRSTWYSTGAYIGAFADHPSTIVSWIIKTSYVDLNNNFTNYNVRKNLDFCLTRILPWERAAFLSGVRQKEAARCRGPKSGGAYVTRVQGIECVFTCHYQRGEGCCWLRRCCLELLDRELFCLISIRG